MLLRLAQHAQMEAPAGQPIMDTPRKSSRQAAGAAAAQQDLEGCCMCTLCRSAGFAGDKIFCRG